MVAYLLERLYFASYWLKLVAVSCLSQSQRTLTDNSRITLDTYLKIAPPLEHYTTSSRL